MSKNVRAKQFLMEEIKKILLREWDPIGIQDIPEAQDEYPTFRTLLRRVKMHSTDFSNQSALGLNRSSIIFQ